MKWGLFLTLFLVIIISMGCSFKKEEVSKVTVYFPKAKQINENKIKNVVSVSRERSGLWGVSDPLSIDDVNCFALFVSWEGSGKYSNCFLEGSNLSLPVLLSAGSVRGGESLTIEVPKGVDRSFYLIGLKGRESQCSKISSITETERLNLSAPFLLGVSKVSLIKDSETVELLAQLDTQKKISSCVGDHFSWSTTIASPLKPVISSIQLQGENSLVLVGNNLDKVLSVSLQQMGLSISTQSITTLILSLPSTLSLVVNQNYDLLINSVYASESAQSYTFSITIPDGAIGTQHIANGAITSAKLGITGSAVNSFLRWNTNSQIWEAGPLGINISFTPGKLPGTGGGGADQPSMGNCPTGYVLVPIVTPYTTTPFCVMKYEAKSGNRGVQSIYNKKPITRVSYSDAMNMCQNLGPGYYLINNSEWMAIATDIFLNVNNWSGLGVGNGHLSRGDTSVDPQPANSDDGYGGTTHRVFTLSTGAKIWDIAGNCAEYVDLVVPSDQRISHQSNMYVSEPEASSVPANGMTLTDIRPQQAYNNNFTNDTHQLGGFYNVPTNETIVAIRGANLGASVNFPYKAEFSGIFALSLTSRPQDLNDGPHSCFRCVYRLPAISSN